MSLCFQNLIMQIILRYCNGERDVLKDKIRKLNEQFPKSGLREIKSLLLTDPVDPILVQRESARILLKEVDPIGSQIRLAVVIK